MACAITDRTTKELKSKTNPKSKIVITRVTQKCSPHEEDLDEELVDDSAEEMIADENNREKINIDTDKEDIERVIQETIDRWAVLAGTHSG